MMDSDCRVLEVPHNGSTSVVSKGKGSGGTCGSRAPMMAKRGYEDGDKGLMRLKRGWM
jgi:hypothetical protein